MKIYLNNQKGQSLIEVIVAMAVFAIIAGAIMNVTLGSLSALTQGGDETEARLLAQEGMEAVRSVRDGAWNDLVYSSAQVVINNNVWEISDSESELINDKYTRTISFSDVCRDASGATAECPASYVDPHTKFVTVNVSWNPRENATNTVEQSGFLTNWESIDWVQTDWAGGEGQDEWSSDTSYSVDDGKVDASTSGELKLGTLDSIPLVSDPDFEGSIETKTNWTFTTAENYSYDTDKIEVAGDIAQLKSVGGSTVSGGTVNETFDLDANSWTFNTWDQKGNEVNPTGARFSSGGDPNGYVEINIPSNAKNNKVGGYWEQSFTVNESNPNATCEINWKGFTAALPSKGADSLFVAVYLDSVSGEPNIGTEVLKKDFTSSFVWESNSGVNSFDCSSSVGTAGTYYYKIAVWLDAVNKNTGPINVGFDNAKVSWEKSTGGSYSADKPTVEPTASFTETGVTSWDSFTETATKDGGEIYYQLSDDNGSTWQFWNGSEWATTSTSTDYNIATDINSHISVFSVISENIKFKAFLESDGGQLVQLDDIEIGFSPASSAWSFNTWDINGGEKTPTGTRYESGGNPDGYVDIGIPDKAKKDTIGGYWEQEIDVLGGNLICELDWRVSDWFVNGGIVNSNQVYFFIDSSSGEPTIGNEVWSSGEILGTTGWSGETFDCTSSAPSSGKYYLKVALWLDAVNEDTGPITLEIDNVQINSSASAYQTSGAVVSSAFDMGDSSPIQIIEWDEVKPVNTNIKFQIRVAPDSGGSPGAWSDWYGISGAGSYFVNNLGFLISSILNENQWMQYRVELSGDGTDTPILQEVRINYK